MDKNLFTSSATGQVVRLDRPFSDFAFIPEELPPKSWHFNPDQWELLSEARENLGTLNGIGQTLPDPELLLRPLQSRESISSSSIEGTYVTPVQLLLYEMDPKEPHSANEKRADWMEVANYSRALRTGCEMIASEPFSNHLIRGLHSILMKGVRGRDKSPGKYREDQVQIGSSGRYVAPPPGEVPRLMGNLVDYINGEDSMHQLVKSFIAHYQFEAIHPFADGNGRVGRAILSMMIYKWLGHARPWLYLSVYFEKYRDEYVQNMFRISTNGDWDSWIEFCLRGTIVQSLDAIERCNRFRSLKDEYHEIVQSQSPTPRTHAIIECLFRSPLVTIPQVGKTHNISYHTAKGDIEKLVKCGILFELEGFRPKTFYAQRIMQIAYRENLPPKGSISSSEPPQLF